MKSMQVADIVSILLSETLGTFFFLTVILTTGQAIPIGIALAAAITFGSFASGAHFNPAVTVMMWLKGDISSPAMPIYIIAQVIGGMLALVWYNSRPRVAASSGSKSF